MIEKRSDSLEAGTASFLSPPFQAATSPSFTGYVFHKAIVPIYKIRLLIIWIINIYSTFVPHLKDIRYDKIFSMLFRPHGLYPCF